MATRTISTKLAIEGEAQYKQSVAACNSELKTLKSSLSLVESEFRNNANSMDALTAKGTALGAVFEAQKEKISTLEAALKNAQQAQEGYAARISTAQENIQRYEQELERLRQSNGDTSEKQAELTRELDKWNAELEEAQAGQAAAERGVQNWQRQLNSANIELNKMSDAIEQNDRYLREAAESADGCATSIDQYGKAVKEAGKSSEAFAEGSGKAQAGIEQLAAALAAAGVAKAVKEIADELTACAGAAAGFETSMAKLSTLLDTSVTPMADIKAQLVELSSETGVAVGSLAEAAYQALSAGVDTADVVSFVATATKTSVAGFTDSATAVDVLTTALNAYSLEGSEAERVASMLVKTQDEGKTSVGELAQNMGRVIPVAAAYNVSLGNLNTAYALLTKNGTNTRIATTNLSAMFSELAKDGSKVADVLKTQTGKSFAELMDSGQSLGGIMELLADSVDGDATAFSNLWSSSTAGQAALALLNSGAEEFNQTLAVMENSTGAVEQNFQTMADTTEFAQQRMATAAENLRIAIGDQLNPALEKLYDTGANAFAWAADFVNEHPEVVGALTAVTVGLGVLTVGVTLAANAENIMEVATGALNAVMAANPAYLVAAGVTALVAAIGIYIATAQSSTSETQEFTRSLQESKAAYEDLMNTIHGQQQDAEKLAASLSELVAVENKSADTKDRIKLLVDQLNQAVPGLALAYDEAADSIIGMDTGVKKTTEDIDAMLKRAAGQEEYNANLERLNKLQNDHRDITDRLKEAQEDLAAAAAKAAEEGNNVTGAYAMGSGPAAAATSTATAYAAGAQAAHDASIDVSLLQNTVDELTAALEDNEAEYAALKADTEAWGQQQADAAAKVAAMTSTVDELTAEMTELETSYLESYDAAHKSISQQLGLFNELDGTAKTSIDDLIKTLQGQVDYMDTYAANIQAAMEMGLNEGLLAQLSDGSEQSAQYLDAIVKGGQEKVAELNEQFAKVEEGKEQFSNTVAQMETDFDKKMAEIVQDLGDAIEEMDLHEEAFKAGQNNIQGLIDGSSDPALRQALAEEYRSMAEEALAAYKAEVGQHSPSKEFKLAAEYDVQGLIDGAEAKKAELNAAYEDLARVAMEGYADGILKNMDKVDRALGELETALRNFDSYYAAKSKVSSLEYELWERTDGKWATDMDKYAKKLEMLTSQQEDQAAVVAEAEAAYKAVVEQYGAASAESYRFQQTLLEEKLAYQDLLDTITEVTNAKHAAFLEQEKERFSTPLPYSDPYQASAALGYPIVTPDFSAAYEAATQNMLTARAAHLPATLEEPSSSRALERQLAAFSAGTVNAIASATQSHAAAPQTFNFMFPDGTQFASYYFDPMVQYAEANGTPILNPKR